MRIKLRISLGILMFAAFLTAPVWAAKKTAKDDSRKTEAKAAPAQEALKPADDSASVNSPDTVLVNVNGQPITQADLDAEMAQINKMMKNRGAPSQQIEMMLKSLKPQILEGLIVRKLIAGECAREKIAVTPEETAREVESFSASLPKKISLEDFLKQSGITREAFERDVAEQIKIEKLLKITPVTDEEIKAYYEQNKTTHFEQPQTVSARHILIATDATDDAAKKKAKRKKAEDLRAKLVKGADFEELARENSDCPSKAKGGKLGEFPRGQMVPAFEEVAFTQKTSEISKVVETDFGYHIIQTLDKNPARTVPLEEVKGQIAFRLKGKKVQEKIEALLKKLKEGAKIEYTQAGEALKPAPMPEGGLPFMPADDQETGKQKSSQAPSGKKSQPQDK